MVRRTSRAPGVSVVVLLVACADWAVAAHAANQSEAALVATRNEGVAIERPDTRARGRLLGATMDVGFPDGAILGAVARPWTWLRLGIGGGTNGVGLGIRGGLAVIPLGTGPSVVLEGGHYFDGNANAVASAFGSTSDGKSVTERIGYQFANLHLGLELGRDRFTFFTHGGMSYIRTVLYNANDVLGGSSENTRVVAASNPVVAAWVPSFKLGLIFYLV